MTIPLRSITFVCLYLMSQSAIGQHRLVFDESGKLLTTPPSKIWADEGVHFEVRVSSAILRERAAEIHKRLKAAYNALRMSNLGDYLEKTYGITNTSHATGIYHVREAILAEIETLNRVYALNSNFSTPYTPRSDPQLTATAEALVEPKYEVVVHLLDKQGLFLHTQTYSHNLRTSPPGDLNRILEITMPPPLAPITQVTHFKCRQIRYELRQKNGFYEEITRLLNVTARPVSLDTLTNESVLAKVAAVEELKKLYDRVVESLKSPAAPDAKLVAEVRKALPKLTSLEDVKNIQFGKIVDEQAAFTWMTRFLWLNEGRLLANPFLFIKPKVRRKDELDQIAADLKQAQSDLNKTTEQLRVLDAVTNQDEAPNGDKLKSYLNQQKKLLDAKAVLDAKIDSLKTRQSELRDEETGRKTEWADRNTELTQDDLLYQGQLHVSEKEEFQPWFDGRWCFSRPETEEVKTRYHDATRQYQLMSLSSPQEVLEGRRMVVQVENERAGKRIAIRYEPKVLQFAPSFLASEIQKAGDFEGFKIGGLMQTGKIAGIMSFNRIPSATPMQIGRSVLENFRNRYAPLLAQAQPFTEGTAPIPLQAAPDTAPAYRSYLLDTPTSLDPPYEVPYRIVEPGTKNDDSVLTSDKLNLSFRVTKLHRFRFKMGLLYSDHRADDYSIGSDGTPSVVYNRRGLDITIGLQVFGGLIDVRDKRFGLRPFGYVGFLVKQRPYENYVIGGGIELLNGLALCYGAHFGKTERLALRNNVLAVDDNRWRAGQFVSLLLDLSIFNSVFNFSAIKSPFEK